MKVKHLMTATILASIGSIGSIASAQSTNLYVGIGAGEARAQKAPDLLGFPAIYATEINNALDTIEGLGSVTGGPSFTSDKSDTAYKIYLGFKGNEHTAIEIGYADFGKFSSSETVRLDYSDPPDSASLSAAAKLEAKNTAWFFDAVGKMPISERFSLIGRVGAAYVKTKSRLSESYNYVSEIDEALLNESGSGSASQSKSRWAPKLGLGVDYQISQGVSVLVEYERYFKVGNRNVGFKSDINMLTAGVKFHF